MFDMEFVRRTPLEAEPFSRKPAGERIVVVTRYGMLHSGLAGALPNTTLQHLISEGDTHTYVLEVRGYSAVDFQDIVQAYAGGDFEKAEWLVAALNAPPRIRRD